MKSALLLFSLFLTNAALAQQVPDLQPIRQANAHFVVTKLTTSPAPGGAQTSISVVCTKDVSIPVFDARPYSSGYSFSTFNSECLGTSGSQPVKVQLSGSILISSNALPGAPFDMKSFNASLYVQQPDGSIESQASAGAWTRDLNLKSLGLTLAPESLVVCQSPPTQSPSTPSNPNPPTARMSFKGPGAPPQPVDPGTCTHAYGDYISATVEITD